MHKFLVAVDRGKNKLFIEPTATNLSWDSFRRLLEDTEEGHCKPGDTFLLGEQKLDDLPEHLGNYLDALLLLERPTDYGEDPQVVTLLRHVFEAGIKFGVEHATEIRARQIRL